MVPKTLNYFCSSLIDPFFEVFEILDNPKHIEYQNLSDDLLNLDKSELENYVTKHNVDRLLSRAENKDQQRRAWFLIDLLQKGIAEKRLSILVTKGRTLPYTSDNLKDIPIDQNNLISVKELSDSHFGLYRNEYFYQLTPSIIQSNSSYWTTIALFKLAAERKIDFKVRLDPFIEKHKDDYNPMVYRMWIYGRPLDWSRIKSLKTEEFGQWLDESQKKDVGLTDFVWRPDEKEVHFTCEELPSSEYVKYRGSRYFHAIFDKKTGNIIHCDGAIRVYDENELQTRNQFHVRNSDVRKIGKRVKIFQIDDELPQDDFGTLAGNFFVWNQDVLNYFDK